MDDRIDNNIERFLELKISYAFRPHLYSKSEEVDFLIQRIRQYDCWTFSKLLNDLLTKYFRDYPENYNYHKDNGILILLENQGFSGSSVFTIEFISIKNKEPLGTEDKKFLHSCLKQVNAVPTGKSFIMKIGPYKDILNEIDNYKKHVKAVLDKAIYPELYSFTSFIDKTAAILYERASNLKSFFDFYGNAKNSNLITTKVDYLFSKLRASWYDKATPRFHDLFQTYHLCDRRERFLLAMRQIVPRDELRKRAVNIIGPGNVPLRQGRNPLDILEDSHIGKLKVLESPIHDDLNPYNILLDESTPNSLKLIDFAGTRCRPTLQDFAKFEMSILFLLYDRNRSYEEWAMIADPINFRSNEVFQTWIVVAIRLIESISTNDFQVETPNDLKTNKFFATIDLIRKHAREYAYTDWVLEYQIALFNWAMRATYWNDSSPAKRVLAYYVGTMLGQLIEKRYSELVGQPGVKL